MQHPAGWYPDPNDSSKERYFNGSAWTTHVRNDIPEIPLAPWVDPAQHILTGGILLDNTPPKSTRSTWLAVAAIAAGVAAVTIVGITVTLNGLGA
ncbi:MAG: DUF2510 domain-containing protein [Ruaniaceae bacterium]|nr:DUF2510 domain-containing protein [Ruaniaceae bacterium]